MSLSHNVRSKGSFNTTPTEPFRFKDDCISFRNKENRSGERFSPCLTPISEINVGETVPLCEIQDLILLYMLKTMLQNLPFIEVFRSLCQRPTLHTLSNACEKSINAQ